MSKIFFSVGLSMDGYIAGENGGPKNPLGDQGTTLHEWLYNQKVFKDNHEWGSGGEEGRDNELMASFMERTGAHILGKRMFDEGEPNWPENSPFHTPTYVLTHQIRDPWERQGGTTFYFINDGLDSALEKAKRAAGEKDIRISGGANTICQFLTAGLIDEFTVHHAPVFLCSGVRLFDVVDKNRFSLEVIDAFHSPLVAHVTYRVRNK